MSDICGYVGAGDPTVLDVMLAAIAYRGDQTDVAHAPGCGLGYRCWGERPAQAPGIHRDGNHVVACAGTLAPPTANPAVTLRERLRPASRRLDDLDGAFACACWNGQRLTLLRDPFGVRALY
jgi:hypothetical protein